MQGYDQWLHGNTAGALFSTTLLGSKVIAIPKTIKNKIDSLKYKNYAAAFCKWSVN